MKEMIELQLDKYDQENIPELKKAMLEDDLKDLDHIHEGEVKLNNVYSFHKDGGIEVGCFLRNATASEIFFGEVSIKLIDKNDGSLVSEGKFHLNKKFKGVGKNKARYFDLFFPLVEHEKSVENESVELTWGEDLDIGETKEIDYPFLEALAHDKDMVKEFISELSYMKNDSVKVDCFSLKKLDDGGIDLIILVRNACDSAISLRKIKMEIMEDKELVAGGEFETAFIKVDANEGKMFRFPMKKAHVFKENINFENCEVKFS